MNAISLAKKRDQEEKKKAGAADTKPTRLCSQRVNPERATLWAGFLSRSRRISNVGDMISDVPMQPGHVGRMVH